jgi:hypothetical protein
MTPDELFDAWERAWSGRDKAAFDPLCHEDVHYEDPLTPEPLEGAAAMATHRREVAGLAATNRFVIVHAVLYCELRDEKLLRIRGFYDLYGAAVQLGVLPKAGTLGEKALLMLRGFGLRA